MPRIWSVAIIGGAILLALACGVSKEARAGWNTTPSGLGATTQIVCDSWAVFYGGTCIGLTPAYNGDGKLFAWQWYVLQTNGQVRSQLTYPNCSAPGQIPDALALSGCSTFSPPNPIQLGCNCTDDSGNTGGKTAVGNPININIGNKFETVIDYESAGPNRLAFIRTYNSQSEYFSSLGWGWQSNFDLRLFFNDTTHVLSSRRIYAKRPDGALFQFNSTGLGTWLSANFDVDATLTTDGSTIWTVTTHDDTVETYAFATGRLISIRNRNGYQRNFAYDASGQLATVTDSYNRQLAFTFVNGVIRTLTDPDGHVYTYSYDGQQVSVPADRLISVAYPGTAPLPTVQYVYENSTYPYALTGIIDENGNRFATWSYDANLRAISSQHAGGADLVTITYNANGTRNLTNALGQQEVYKFVNFNSVFKVSEIDRLATATTAAATRLFVYDSKGYLANATDWNGTHTAYVNDVRGQPTSITEAVGKPEARVTTTTYHATFHVPTQIVTPGLTTIFTYDSNGNLQTKTETDTATTPNVSRSWTYSYNATGELTSVQGPRTDVTQTTSFGYDSSGALTSVTNALGQVTQVTAHTAGGLPTTIVDPNGVTTQLAYDPRWRLQSRMLATGSGNLTTTYNRDAAGNLTSVTLPDNSALSYAHDAAHRVTGVTDLLGQSIAYTLDALGGRTQTAVSDASATVQRQHADSFDALGRVLVDTGGANQLTDFAYDGNGNAVTITDPRNGVTQQFFDGLNRLIKTIDAAGGITRTSYDAHDRVTGVIDPNNHTTTYLYDGFGNLTQKTSPDTGITHYSYDLAGNFLQSTDAAGVVTNHSYDALDRILTTSYPGNAAENVSYVYDEAAHGFGIGRLTTLTDPAGTLTRSYDERGNVVTETRNIGSVALTTATSYDAASRIASITYPSQWIVAYARDAMGRVTGVTTQPPAGTPLSVASGVTYQPFGPLNALAFGNGITESRNFDLDYRLTGRTVTSTGPGTQQDLYTYDAADNVTAITDFLGNNQPLLQYDALNRLTHAEGSYGTLTWSYDATGNRQTQSQTVGTQTTLSTYTYAPGTNQLASLQVGSSNYSFGASPAGSMAAIAQGATTLNSFVYNQAQRLARVTAGPAQSIVVDYTYDAFGQRIAKTFSGGSATLFQYDRAGHLIEETDSSGAAQRDYIYLGDRPIASMTPGAGTLVFVHDDRLGTPEAVTDTTQSFAWSGALDPFGNPVAVSGITFNLRLPGQYYDSETGLGLHQNGMRDYYPFLGRYIESDPIGLAGGINTYAYANGNPVNNIDPYGLQAIPMPTMVPPIPGMPGIGIPPNAQPPQWLKDVFKNPFSGSKESTAAESRGNSDPDSAKGLTPVNPGKDCDGNCNPCPPDQQWSAPGNDHGSTSGSHSHGIKWNQNRATCWCFPQRVSGPDAENMK